MLKSMNKWIVNFSEWEGSIEVMTHNLAVMPFAQKGVEIKVITLNKWTLVWCFVYVLRLQWISCIICG